VVSPPVLAKRIGDYVFRLMENDVALDANAHVALQRDNNRWFLSWASEHPWQASIINSDFATISEYRALLENRAFSAILYDGSALQISYIFEGNTVTKHRLCYYPCPLLIAPDEVQAESLLDFISNLSAEEVDRRLRLRSPIRFDFDPDSVADDHPSSHMHISFEECRIAVAGPLSAGRFFEFVLRNFYRDAWNSKNGIRDFRIDAHERVISEADRVWAHVNWD